MKHVVAKRRPPPGPTPGPWTAVDLGSYHQVQARHPLFPGGLVVAAIGTMHAGDDRLAREVSDNAALIAAAPELLECCRAMLELHETGSWGAPPDEYLERLRAAVAKASPT